MFRRTVVALVVGAVVALSASSADPVPVAGSSAKFPRSVSIPVGQKAVTLKLTGVGMRTKVVFNVYAIGSYLQDGAAVKTADDLARADAARMLYLVMERTVGSADFLDAFKTAVGRTYPADKFAAEFAQLAAAVGDKAAQRGDHVSLLYVPGTGLRVQIVGKVDVTIKSPAFAQALWEVYLGPKPIDDDLKKGLTSLLTR
jgi:hypothetical protein